MFGDPLLEAYDVARDDRATEQADRERSRIRPETDVRGRDRSRDVVRFSFRCPSCHLLHTDRARCIRCGRITVRTREYNPPPDRDCRCHGTGRIVQPGTTWGGPAVRVYRCGRCDP